MSEFHDLISRLQPYYNDLSPQRAKLLDEVINEIADLKKANLILQSFMDNRDVEIESLRAQLAEARTALEEINENWAHTLLVRKIARRALTGE